MNSLWVFVLLSLVHQSLGHDLKSVPESRSITTWVLNQFLDPIYKELPKKPLPLPDVNMGNMGKLSNLEMKILGELTKEFRDFKSLGFQLDTNATKVTLRGQYLFNNLDLPGLFPVSGKGHFFIAVEVLNLNMKISALKDSAADKFNITVSKFSLAAGNSTVKFENLMDDPDITGFLNELVGNLIPDLVTMINEPIQPLVKDLAQNLGNGIFKCILTQPFKFKECILQFLKGEKNVDHLVSSKFQEIFHSRNLL